MINSITTIQEITAQAIEFGLFKTMFNDKNMSRDEIFNTFEEWGREFEKKHEGREWNGEYYDEIDKFIMEKADTL